MHELQCLLPAVVLALIRHEGIMQSEDNAQQRTSGVEAGCEGMLLAVMLLVTAVSTHCLSCVQKLLLIRHTWVRMC